MVFHLGRVGVTMASHPPLAASPGLPGHPGDSGSVSGASGIGVNAGSMHAVASYGGSSGASPPPLGGAGMYGHQPQQHQAIGSRSPTGIIQVQEFKPQVVTVPQGARKLAEVPDIIHVNVGGHRFCTTARTLTAHSDSMLGRMFSGDHPILR